MKRTVGIGQGLNSFCKDISTYMKAGSEEGIVEREDELQFLTSLFMVGGEDTGTPWASIA
jgi:hypothetical protein